MIRSFRDGGWRYCRERLGFFKRDPVTRIHVHAASVGEVLTVLPLLQHLEQTHPSLQFLLTSNTPTGAQMVQKHAGHTIKHAYLPIDFGYATKQFFKRHSLSACWIVETEIWPWLFSRAQQSDVPVTIINARLSLRSRGAVANFFNDTYTQALSKVRILARSDDDANFFLQRGAQPDLVQSVGNLKLANVHNDTFSNSLIAQPYCLAASTHDDEELRIAQAWLHAEPAGLLVIAPRHPERGGVICNMLNALQQQIDPNLLNVKQRSLGEIPTAKCRLYVADTLGELNQWYAFAHAAFVGGSLVPHGGHNVIEAAQNRCAIVVGPHMFNFENECELLRNKQGIAIAQNADETIELLQLSIDKPAWAAALSDRAYNAINAQTDILPKYVTHLLVC